MGTKKRLSDLQSFVRLFDEHGVVYELGGTTDSLRAIYVESMGKTIVFTISGYLARIADGKFGV